MTKPIDRLENDSNSTYCEDCGCRITIGRCKHGVMPPRTLLVVDKDSNFTRKGGAAKQEVAERTQGAVMRKHEADRHICDTCHAQGHKATQ